MAWPSGRQRVVHLLGQLAGRHEDQATRGAAALLDLGADAGEQRQAEGQRLARAGGGLAEHVAAGERVRAVRRSGWRTGGGCRAARGRSPAAGAGPAGRRSGRSGASTDGCSQGWCLRGVLTAFDSNETGWIKVMRGGAPYTARSASRGKGGRRQEAGVLTGDRCAQGWNAGSARMRSCPDKPSGRMTGRCAGTPRLAAKIAAAIPERGWPWSPPSSVSRAARRTPAGRRSSSSRVRSALREEARPPARAR